MKKIFSIAFVFVLILALASAAFADDPFYIDENGFVAGTYEASGCFIDIKVNGASARAGIDSVTILYSPAEEENTVEVYVDGALAAVYTVTEEGSSLAEIPAPQGEYANEYETYGIVVEDYEDEAETAAEAETGAAPAEAGQAETAAPAEEGGAEAAAPSAASAGTSAKAARSAPKTGYIIGAAVCVVVILAVVCILLFSGRKKSKH